MRALLHFKKPKQHVSVREAAVLPTRGGGSHENSSKPNSRDGSRSHVRPALATTFLSGTLILDRPFSAVVLRIILDSRRALKMGVRVRCFAAYHPGSAQLVQLAALRLTLRAADLEFEFEFETESVVRGLQLLRR